MDSRGLKKRIYGHEFPLIYITPYVLFACNTACGANQWAANPVSQTNLRNRESKAIGGLVNRPLLPPGRG